MFILAKVQNLSVGKYNRSVYEIYALKKSVMQYNVLSIYDKLFGLKVYLHFVSSSEIYPFIAVSTIYLTIVYDVPKIKAQNDSKSLNICIMLIDHFKMKEP